MSKEIIHPIKVQLLFRQNLIRIALGALLESRAGFCVINDEDLSCNPDILLLDIDSKEASRQVIQVEGAKILAIASAALPDSLNRAIEVGAKGLVLKEQCVETLFRAIERVHAGEIWFDRKHLISLIEKVSSTPGSDVLRLNQLTRRELDVVRLIGSGLRNREIAERLFISERTVRAHLESIFQKLRIKDRVELAIWSVNMR